MERLAADDDFRAQLEENPRAVLADYGIDVPEELVPSQVQLPAKDEVEQIRGVLSQPAIGVPEFPCLWIGLAILSRALTHRHGADAA